jgi:hypothetical protein
VFFICTFRSSEQVSFFFCFFSRNLGCFGRRLLQSSSGVASVFLPSRFRFVPRSAPVRKQQLPQVLESLLLPSFGRFSCSPPDFPAASLLGRFLCSLQDFRAASPRRLLSAPVGSIASDSSFLCVRMCRRTFSSPLDLLRRRSPVQLRECANFLSRSRSVDPTLADQGEPCVSYRKHLRY